MTNYREILRLKSLGFSERNIALSCSCSRNTVSKVVKKAEELNFQWHLINSKTNAELEQDLFPNNTARPPKPLPDFNYIRKELLKNGVNKSFYGLNTSRNANSTVMNR